MSLKKITRDLKAYYQASAENRTGIHLFLGLVIIPAIGLTLLFFYVYNFYL